MTPTSSLGRLLLWLAAGIFLVLQVSLWFGEGGILGQRDQTGFGEVKAECFP